MYYPYSYASRIAVGIAVGMYVRIAVKFVPCRIFQPSYLSCPGRDTPLATVTPGRLSCLVETHHSSAVFLPRHISCECDVTSAAEVGAAVWRCRPGHLAGRFRPVLPAAPFIVAVAAPGLSRQCDDALHARLLHLQRHGTVVAAREPAPRRKPAWMTDSSATSGSPVISHIIAANYVFEYAAQ